MLKVTIMKALVSAIFVSCALAAPVCAFAQSSDGPVTRAEVRADLQRVEQAGYRPGGSEINYPNDIQHAEAIVAQENTTSNAAMGGTAMTGTSGSGAPAVQTTVHSGDQGLYSKH